MKPIDGAARTRKTISAKFIAPLAAGIAALAGSPAMAACLQSGNTVTCSGASATGFGTGVENNLALTVQPDGLITLGAAQNGIYLGAGNTAINNGAIVVGNGGYGMLGFDNNTFTNNGSITVSTSAVGMAAFGNNNTFTNAGTIGSAAQTSFGMAIVGTGNTVLNSGTISLIGDNSIGIRDLGDNNSITNSGTIAMGGTNSSGINVTAAGGGTVLNSGLISVGDNSIGIQGLGNNIFTNNGMMTIGSNSVAMFVVGNNNVLANTGTINSTGSGAVGLSLLGTGHTVTNSGTISLTGTGSYGIAAGVMGTTILNSGIVTVGSGSTGTNGVGVWLMSGANFTNTGTVTGAGDSGRGVDVGDDNTMINNGTISATGGLGTAVGISGLNNTIVNNSIVRGGVNGYSLVSLGTTGTSITNNGTLDGQMMVHGTGNSLINAGLITITDPGTALTAGNLTFSGTFTQTAAGTLSLRLGNTGLHDSLLVHQANLNGTLRAVLQAGLYGTTTTYQDVLVSSTSVAGQFANVTSSSAFFNAVATYNAGSVDLTLTRQGFGAVAGETANQRSIGNALEAGYSTALTGAAATFYSNLLQAGSLRVLDQLSGEGSSGTQNTAFNAGTLFGQTMDSQMAAWRAGSRGGVNGGAALGYAAEEPRGPAAAFAALKAPVMAQPQWNVWAAAFGAGQQLSGNAGVGSASFSDRAAGGSMGVDRLVNPDLLVGVAAGGSSATFSVDDRATSGRLEGAHVGAYAMQRYGASYLSAQIAYSHFNNSTTRTIAGVGPTETAQGSFASDQFGGRLEIGRAYDFGLISATPFAAIQAARLWQSAYTETSTAGAAPGVLGLSYAARAVNSLPAFLGVKFDGHTALGNGMIWTPFVHAAWVHEFKPSRTITASLTGLPVPAFTVAGASAASDAARLDLGSRLAITRGWEVSARVSGEFSNLGQSYSGMGALKASW
ncbi:autotransporter domain-containing protein [Bradyrhizobium sediminis]|uniref:Autotransporter domain-containing protein n=1 Tax=Bradyrhizobium sediminis TaxID=2840469 RepID=A0A975NHH9_9BRAD|nr:autotransporter outer membrane beta-barrel domain-containing protein [Bradyrhizobium sediminis]QWG15257.1 autotransporter domain-containing protein [Bradyrhizobium sediminis]